MRKAYLLVYSSTLGTRVQIQECLNELPQVIHWRHDLPHAYYIISEVEEAQELAGLIRACRHGKGRFILTEVSTNKGGWLPKDSWYLIKHKRHKPKSS